MSRLSHRQKKYYTQMVVYLFLLILFVVFLATIGVKIILNLSAFIANSSNKSQNNAASNETTYLLPPIINDLPDATNSAKITMTGTATEDPNNTIGLFVNGKNLKDIPLENGNFQTIVDLTKGANDVYVVLKNSKSSLAKESKHFKVTYLTDKPKLDVSSPSDNQKTNNMYLPVIGQTDKGVNLTINGSPVVVDANGNFSSQVNLKSGDNKITIIVTDVAGNSTEKDLTVSYSTDY